MARFRYLRPDTIEEAARMLADGGDGAKILSGGQSLIPLITLGLARPDVLIDIGRIADAGGLTVREGAVHVGPLVRHVAFERLSPELRRAAPSLETTVPWIAHAAIRSRGTFLGSVAHADPAAEWPAVALALDAELTARSIRGSRRIRADEFFLGPLTTALEPDEILVDAAIAAARPRTGAATLELTYRHGDYAVVGVVAQVTLGARDGAIDEARIGLFGVGATPIRARESEVALVAMGRDGLDEAAGLARGASDPSSDATASAGYRRRMVAVFVRRTVAAAIERAAAA